MLPSPIPSGPATIRLASEVRWSIKAASTISPTESRAASTHKTEVRSSRGGCPVSLPGPVAAPHATAKRRRARNAMKSQMTRVVRVVAARAGAAALAAAPAASAVEVEAVSAAEAEAALAVAASADPIMPRRSRRTERSITSKATARPWSSRRATSSSCWPATRSPMMTKDLAGRRRSATARSFSAQTNICTAWRPIDSSHHHGLS